MRLISCHIENFGKLHDCSMHFTEGLNTFCEENGWGKSTFAAFLCVMFYGFDATTSRDIEKNDRKKYKPWQGGVYGGSLCFEAAGKRYRLTRSFDDKEANDGFDLRDADTNLPSGDYSRKIGEELFGINKESFARTAFLRQNQCETEATADINAGIGRLTEASDDMGSFDHAMIILKNRANALSPKRLPGSVKKREGDIQDLTRQLQAGSDLESALKQTEERCDEATEREKSLSEQLGVLTALQERVAGQAVLLEKRQSRERLRTAAEQKRAVVSELRGKLPEVLPEKSVLKQCLEDCRALELAEVKAERDRLTEAEEESLAGLRDRLGEQAPAVEEVLSVIRSVKELKELRNQLALDQIKKQTELEQYKDEYRMQVKRALRISPLFYVGLAIIAVGLGLLTVQLQLGVGVMVIGLILVFATLLTRGKKGLPAPEPKVTQLEAELAADQRTLEDAESELEQAVRYLAGYGIASDEGSLTEDLYVLKEDAAALRLLEEKAGRYEASCAWTRDEEERVKRCLAEIGISEDGDRETLLKGLLETLDDYEDALLEAGGREEELRRFESEEDLAALNAPAEEGLPTLPELQQNSRDLQEQRERNQEELHRYRKNLELLQEKLEEREELQEQLRELHALQERERTCYRYVTKAQELLSGAKEALTSRYSDPILKSFLHYYGSIAGEGAKEFFLDANTNITLQEQGMQRETNTLSAGIRDLIGICLRVSLVDAMYETERPVLILDDPFTNLDDEKTEAAKAFLETVSKEYQVLYFTCSKARQV